MTENEDDAWIRDALARRSEHIEVPPLRTDVAPRRHRKRHTTPQKVVALVACTSVAIAGLLQLQHSPNPKVQVETTPPATSAWSLRPIDGFPLKPRIRPAIVSVGTSIVVWGGDDDRISKQSRDADVSSFYNDGAIYQTATHTWSVLPSSPMRPSQDIAEGIAIGEHQLVVWRGNDIAILDLAPTPRWSAHRTFSKSLLTVAWTGQELLVVGPNEAVERDLNLIRRLPPIGFVLQRAALHWSGENAVLIGRAAGTDGSADRAIALKLTGDRWTDISPPNFNSQMVESISMNAGIDVMLATLDAITIEHLDPGNGRWQTLPFPRTEPAIWLPNITGVGRTMVVLKQGLLVRVGSTWNRPITAVELPSIIKMAPVNEQTFVLIGMSEGDTKQRMFLLGKVHDDDPSPSNSTTSTTHSPVSQAPEAGDAARWSIASSPSPTQSTITALVRRVGCAGGTTGKVLRPGIVVTDAEIVVTFNVAPISGAQTCPGNDAVHYVLDFGLAIGKRRLIDGSCRAAGAAKSTSSCQDGGVRWVPSQR